MSATESSDFNFLADFLPQMIYIARADNGQLEYLNKYWVEYTGLSNEESYLGAWEKVIHPDDLPLLIKAWQNAMAAKSPWELEYRIKNKDGNYFWFLGRSVPLLKEKVVKWYGTAVNIHDSKQKELELQKKNELLDTFVYAAVHEFKGKISNLVALSEMLDTIDNNESKEAIFKGIQISSGKLERAIKGLSELIKIQNDDNEIYEKTSFASVLNQISSDYSSLIESKEAVITSSFKIEEIKYIEQFLNTIIKNLLTNALKYNSRNITPVINISTSEEEGYILLTITDNGTGIDLEKYNHQLFLPFKRFNSDTEGTGLGLYLVKNIVEKNGGKITITSKPGEGTTFICYLKPY